MPRPGVLGASSVLAALLLVFTIQTVLTTMTRYTAGPQAVLASSLALLGYAQSVNTSWRAPQGSDIDDLAGIMNRTGVYGFVFNSSQTPSSVPYSTYNWCNMPHVRAKEYPRADPSYTLEYVEIIHRHHKRTPYAANTFPKENYGWDCSDQGLFYSGATLPITEDTSASTYWAVYNTTFNPFNASGFPGTCRFPQITSGGLRDSYQHGLDIASVYKDLLHFLPSTYDPNIITFRVTSNVITSQVASSLIPGMYPELSAQPVPLLIQPGPVESLEPAYSCPTSSTGFSAIRSSPAWSRNLNLSSPLIKALDALSGVSPEADDWHVSWDHYFDNLSARLCHDLPLPYSSPSPSADDKDPSAADCVTLPEAETVFRLGQWEYSYLYRAGGPGTLDASVAGYGVWIAELAEHWRERAVGPAAGEGADDGGGGGGGQGVRYRHNVAHDGSLSRLLSVLQVEKMVWPGMGAELVFELFSKGADDQSVPTKQWFVRILWGGAVLESSVLGKVDMVPLEKVLKYFDDLVGVKAIKVPGLCGLS